MTPANVLSETALGWVREDLDKLLHTSRLQVENIANNPHAGEAALDQTAATLEQLMLTFATLKLDGVRQVAREMHGVCGRINGEAGPARDQAVGALMEAVVVLPSYLDRLQAGHGDQPVLLLPVINKLREAADAEPLSESTLFTPVLDVELPELDFVRRPGYEEPFEYFVARMARQYESALEHWLAEQHDLSLLAPLQGICETLRHRLEAYPLKRLCWVATEVLGGMLEEFVDNDAHLRRLLARLRGLLGTIVEGGESVVDQAAVLSLTQALLYHAAKARPGHSGLDLVRRRFELSRLMPDREALMKARGTLSGRDRAMFESLRAAVREELALVKDALDLELRTGKVKPEAHRQTIEALDRLADTLRLLGLSRLGDSVSEGLAGYEGGTGDDRQTRSAQLVDLAERLLQVESALEEQAATLGQVPEREQQDSPVRLSAFEQLRIESRLLDEAVLSVHQSQEAVRRRLDGDRDANPAPPLEHVAGALRLIGESQAADRVEQLQAVLDRRLHQAYSTAALGEGELESLADALAALELHLAASRDQQGHDDRFLDTLGERLDRLVVEPAGAHQQDPPRLRTVPRDDSTTAAAPHSPPGEPEPEASAEPALPPTRAPGPVTGQEDALPEAIDPELRDIFLEEYETVLESLQHAIPAWMNRLDDVEALTEIRRAFHTLKGSGRMVGADELGDFAWQIEDMLNALLEGRVERFGDISVMVRLAQASLPSLRQRLLQETSGLKRGVIELIGEQAQALGRGEGGDWSTLRRLLPAYLAGMLPGALDGDAEPAGTSSDDELESMLRTELEQGLAHLQVLLEALSRNRATSADADQLRAIHSVAGALAMHPEGREAEIAAALERVIEAQARSGWQYGNDDLWTLLTAVGHIQARLDRLAGQPDVAAPGDAAELLEQLERLATQVGGASGPARAAATEPATTPPGTDAKGAIQGPAADGFDPGRSVFARAGEEREEFDAATDWLDDARAPAPEAIDNDDDITRIFLEEAREVLERSDESLHRWRDELSELGWVRNLQREIHTFKGGARMAGLAGMGEFAHTMESLLERIAERRLEPSVSAVQVLEDGCDRLHAWVQQVERGQAPETASARDLLLQQARALEDVGVAPPEPAPASEEPAREVREIPEGQPEPVEAEDERGGGHIRVASDLLDSLVNAAGEVSIFRSRLEQQFGGLRDHLSEFDETMSRLREQFRKLEIEIEAQVRSSYSEVQRRGGDDFDPLELDEFSTLHQLARGLSESVADLLNLQEMLAENARRSEKLLLQQSRVSTELQEGLMKTRMVPFGTIAPRLRRLVRTAAKESGKQARLQLRMVGSSDELDRNVLETITAPLEHLMRNAVVHGIEPAAARREAGKEAEGEITITVESEATEFVIRIEDDGAGIDTEAIRQRAIERGLLDEGARPRLQQLYDFMLESGFSTSSEVTRLAGRGVGMDVVNSEIKQIGGSLEIESEPGQGTRFTIRIPFTLAVMQAIGLVAGEQRYLLPLSSVVGVARVLPDDYRALVGKDEPSYRFAGQEYPVLDIEALLGEPSRPLARDNVSLLIVAAGEQRAALRVPELLPHREVVIKPVGPQISCVPGILGGSIAANGEVVVILDPGPLIRHAIARGVSPALALEGPAARTARKLVMVVDDSITMRKVTSRVLESHDFEVFTARDGVDATEQLEERTPDLMLLDIEMPRMDGYELTEYVRDHARLRHIPIMMITSRAGQKHRDRAQQAGANAYLTKPYSERDLIEQVNLLLEHGTARHE